MPVSRSGAWVRGLGILVVSVLGAATGWTQTSVGRGARDPLQPPVIVGSEGKGMFTGAGIPPGNTPIFAARTARCRPASSRCRRHLHDQGLLQGSRALDRSALLPLQLAGRARADLGRLRGAVDRRRSAALGRLGFLRPRLPARGNREPVPVQDGEGALRGAARGDARERRPHAYTQATLPDWNGRYLRQRAKTASWYLRRDLADPDVSLAADARVSEALRAADVSLLGQQRGAVAGLVLLARRLHAAARAVRRRRVNLVMTPELVLDMRNAAKTLITQIHIGREFNEEGVVPRLGPDVPQWFGETIGFWDGEALITWTSNIQGWISHGGFEFSNKLQSIEIYTPRKDASGKLDRHQARDRALRRRGVRRARAHRADARQDRELNEGDPFAIMECVPQSFPVDGDATPMAPGRRSSTRVPDIYGRPVGADLGALPRGRHGAAARADGPVRTLIELMRGAAECVRGALAWRARRSAVILLALFAASYAHHSFAMYDVKKTYVMTGS